MPSVKRVKTVLCEPLLDELLSRLFRKIRQHQRKAINLFSSAAALRFPSNVL
jgi:hypothetical protein